MVRKNYVMKDPEVSFESNRFIYKGSMIPVYNQGKALDILVYGNVLRQPKIEIYRGGIYGKGVDVSNNAPDGIENEIDQLIDLIEKPNGEEQLKFLRLKESAALKLPKRSIFRDPRSLFDKRYEREISMNTSEAHIVSQKITKEIFGNTGDRYALISTPTAIKSYMDKKTKTEFRKDPYWIQHREIILEENYGENDEIIEELISSLRSRWGERDGRDKINVNSNRIEEHGNHVVLEKLRKDQVKLALRI